MFDAHSMVLTCFDPVTPISIPTPCPESSVGLPPESGEVAAKAEGIENELFYARNGSVFPASLHGVHWMDQRGTSLRKRGKYEEEPDYKQVRGDFRWMLTKKSINNVVWLFAIQDSVASSWSTGF